jgi:hypothetical protein
MAPRVAKELSLKDDKRLTPKDVIERTSGGDKRMAPRGDAPDDSGKDALRGISWKEP